MARSLTKKVRFDVFKRDLFTCQYCGNTPPGVVLEVDHIMAVANGGSNDIDNLITACFDCNRGKSATPLTQVPRTIINKMEVIEEREEQIKAYNKILKAKRKRLMRDALAIADVYKNYFGIWSLKQEFVSTSLCKFLELLPYQEVFEAMTIACARKTSHQAPRYFCGICWKKVRDGRNGQV